MNATTAGAVFLIVLALGMAGLVWLVYRDRRRSAPAPAPERGLEPAAAPLTLAAPPITIAATPTLDVTAAEIGALLDELWTKRTPLTELAQACAKPWPVDHAAQLLTAWRNEQ